MMTSTAQGSAIEPRDLTGLVLMGGQSRRMGQDKAWMPWHGEPLWQRQVRLLATLCAPVWRAVRHGARPEPNIIVDASPFPGPAPALVQALTSMPGTWLLVLAVDLPQVDLALLQALVAARTPDGVTMAASLARIQPLCSIWHRSAAERLPNPEQTVNASIQSLLTRVPQSTYHLPAERSHLLHNVNAPEDWKQAENMRPADNPKDGPR